MSKSWSKQSYVSEFLNLKCAGDVLNVTSPIGNDAQKEITESMGVISVLKGLIEGECVLYDLCAGNALTSVLSAHLFPKVKEAYAIDKRIRNRRWNECRRFSYINWDIYDIPYSFFEENSIIISVHPCQNLAKRVVDLYNNSKAKYLILMPCCEGGLSGENQSFCDEYGKQLAWCYELFMECKGTGLMFKDEKIKSPKNYIMVVQKED